MVEGPHNSLTPGGWKRGKRGARTDSPGRPPTGCPPPETGPAPQSCPPPPTAYPPEPPATGGAWAETVKPPPRSHRREAPGNQRGTARSPGAPPPPPPSPLPPPPPHGQPEAGQGDSGPASPPLERAPAPREGRHWAGTRHAPSLPPAHSHSNRDRPAVLRRRARAPRGRHPGGSTRTRAGAVWGPRPPGTGNRR